MWSRISLCWLANVTTLQRKTLPQLESAVEEMTVQCDNLKDELNSDMQSQLNNNEQREGMRAAHLC